jgi:uncharacterized membrane protein YjjP (DUF1212 family)
MIDMLLNTIQLFFANKLFAEPSKAYAQLATGVGVAAALLVLLTKLIGLPLIVSAAVAGFVGGALQPYLFRKLRYR